MFNNETFLVNHVVKPASQNLPGARRELLLGHEGPHVRSEAPGQEVARCIVSLATTSSLHVA